MVRKQQCNPKDIYYNLYLWDSFITKFLNVNFNENRKIQ